MSYVSRQAFELALQSATVVERHGRAFEKISELVKQSALTECQSESIKHAGQQIQYQGQTMRVLVEQSLQEDDQYQLDRYIAVHRHQHQAVIQYLKSIECLLEAISLLLMFPSSDVSSR